MSDQSAPAWYYAPGNTRLGPVTDAEMLALVTSGAVGPDALVWRSGFAEWVPAASVFNPQPPSASLHQQALCAECGRSFPAASLVQIERVSVCEQCKPVVVQKVMEGVRLETFSAIGAWKDGRYVLTNDGAVLTARCVRCNAPAIKTLKRKLQWHSPVVYLLLVVAVLIYLIVAMILRKNAIITIGLCDAHQKRRVIDISIFWLGLLGGIAISIWGFSNDLTGVGFSGILVSLVCMFYGAIRMNVVTAHRIDAEGRVWLKGVGKAFRDSLPSA